ncbi:MAG: MaoC family dehydratase [Nanoarchaeota archaeon]
MLIFKGIGQAIGSLFGVDPKPVDESWEERINKALAAEREKIRPSREDMDIFSWVTGDNNPIHRLQRRAKELGFNDIPVMGAHVAAYGEQFAERVVENMREYWGADIRIIGQDTKFRAALYPTERTLWQVTGYRAPKEDEEGEEKEEIQLNITGTVKDRRVVDITSRLGKEFPPMPQIAGPIPNASRRYLLLPEHLTEFDNCVGASGNGTIPHMLPAAYVPATLLRLLEDRTQTMEGANFSMNFDFLGEAKPGRLQVDIFPPRSPKLQKRKDIDGGYLLDPLSGGAPIIEGYIYNFNAVVSQDSKPITYGTIRCSSPRRMDFST